MHPPLPQRRTIRLPEYDYTQPSAYFITLVTAGRVSHFGGIENGQMQLNWLGQMVQTEWKNLSSRFQGRSSEFFVVMPNHIHGLLEFEEQHESIHNPSNHCYSANPQTVSHSVGAIVRAFKSSTTLRYARTRSAAPGPLWQRNYYEHIVRSQAELEKICAYILNNPAQWEQDRENPNPPPEGRGAAGR